jgi:hypothetical protein
VSEENKALMHRFYEEWVHPGNLDVVEEIIAPDCPLYFGGTFMGTGPEAFKQGRAMMYAGFPDLRWLREWSATEFKDTNPHISQNICA